MELSKATNEFMNFNYLQSHLTTHNPKGCKVTLTFWY